MRKRSRFPYYVYGTAWCFCGAVLLRWHHVLFGGAEVAAGTLIVLLVYLRQR